MRDASRAPLPAETRVVLCRRWTDRAVTVNRTTLESPIGAAACPYDIFNPKTILALGEFGLSRCHSDLVLEI